MDDMSCSHQARQYGNVPLQTSTTCSPRCRVSVLSPPAIRFLVLLLLLASVVEPAAVDYRPAASSERGSVEPRARYHNQRLVNGQLETWQVARCRQQEHYVACFLCGKIVQSRDLYYGCCRMNAIVLQFCDELLA